MAQRVGQRLTLAGRQLAHPSPRVPDTRMVQQQAGTVGPDPADRQQQLDHMAGPRHVVEVTQQPGQQGAAVHRGLFGDAPAQVRGGETALVGGG